jgi:Ca-activated chloride channel family protein
MEQIVAPNDRIRRAWLPFLGLLAVSVATAVATAGDVTPSGGGDNAAAAESPSMAAVQRTLASGGTLDDDTLQRILDIQHTEVERVRLVLLPVSVEDRRGRRVRGLTESDFAVFEDRVRQRIEYFSVESQEPVAIAFLLDVSGSMRQLGKLEAAKEAIRHFVENLRPLDRFALICFADEQVSWVTEFTSDRERFLERLDVQRGYGQTALNDAVAATPRLVFEDDTEMKKAIVLITDGVDNVSRLTTEEAIDTARYSSVPIYTIGFSALPEYLISKGETVYNLRILRRFSGETGGALFVVHDPDELKEAVARIEEELRFQYLIGYYPTRRVWDGGFRKVDLRLRKNRLEVRTRSGYYATP